MRRIIGAVVTVLAGAITLGVSAALGAWAALRIIG